MKISVRPTYTPLVQLRWHCAPCCIQWVLLRRGLKIYDQEEIGHLVNLKVPKKLRNLFSHKVRWTTDPKKYGVTNMQKHINIFFKKKHLPLKCEFSHWDEIECHETFIEKKIKSNNDIIVCFNWRGLGKKNKNTGHCCVIAAIKNGKRPIVTLGDPSFKHLKFWDVRLTKLVHAMDKKYDGIKRGFFVIGKK
jgi:hypothetical protein